MLPIYIPFNFYLNLPLTPSFRTCWWCFSKLKCKFAIRLINTFLCIITFHAQKSYEITLFLRVSQQKYNLILSTGPFEHRNVSGLAQSLWIVCNRYMGRVLNTSLVIYHSVMLALVQKLSELSTNVMLGSCSSWLGFWLRTGHWKAWITYICQLRTYGFC